MPRRALNVAPTDGSSKFNTIRIPLIPVACWRLEDPSFDFDSSFVSAKFRGEMVPTDPGQDTAEDDGLSETSGAPDSPLTTLSGIVSQNQGCPAAIFGHCDPAGSDALNKTLGDRRAIAVYALVTRQPDLWAYLYDNPQVGDKWDLKMVQAMLHHVRDASGRPYLKPFVAYEPTGVRDSDTIDAVKRFQADCGLTSDGDPGSKTRKVLFGAYMDWLCTPSPGSASPADTTSTPPRFTMQPSDFLGGSGAQAGDLPKMSLQSCGKFNPILLLTTGEMGGEDTTDGASKVQRNIDDAPNRRVIMYLFPKGTKVDSTQWPCPKVKESNDACKSQFWPDGDSRRKNVDTQREYKVTRDTMACRFYDRFARRSPCEGAPPAFRVAIPVELVFGWPKDAVLVISDDQGNELRRKPVGSPPANSYYYFGVPAVAGRSYSVDLTWGDTHVHLFSETTPARIMDTSDPDYKTVERPLQFVKPPEAYDVGV